MLLPGAAGNGLAALMLRPERSPPVVETHGAVFIAAGTFGIARDCATTKRGLELAREPEQGVRGMSGGAQGAWPAVRGGPWTRARVVPTPMRSRPASGRPWGVLGSAPRARSTPALLADHARRRQPGRCMDLPRRLRQRRSAGEARRSRDRIRPPLARAARGQTHLTSHHLRQGPVQERLDPMGKEVSCCGCWPK